MREEGREGVEWSRMDYSKRKEEQEPQRLGEEEEREGGN